MRDSITVLAGVTCVLLAMSTPAGDAVAQKQPKKVRVNRCVKYSQSQRDEGMTLSLRSKCEPRVTCELRWQLVCEGEDPRHEAEAFSLDTGDLHSADASAAACGDAAWEITGVRWNCEVDG